MKKGGKYLTGEMQNCSQSNNLINSCSFRERISTTGYFNLKYLQLVIEKGSPLEKF